jgi:hypothetical protein
VLYSMCAGTVKLIQFETLFKLLPQNLAYWLSCFNTFLMQPVVQIDGQACVYGCGHFFNFCLSHIGVFSLLIRCYCVVFLVSNVSEVCQASNVSTPCQASNLLAHCQASIVQDLP